MVSMSALSLAENVACCSTECDHAFVITHGADGSIGMLPALDEELEAVRPGEAGWTHCRRHGTV